MHIRSVYTWLLTAFALGALALTAQADDVSPETISGTTTIDTAKAKQLFDTGVPFVDVRKDSDWEAGRIPGAIHLELKNVYTADSLAAEVKKDETVVIYCNGPKCLRSSEACKQAVAWGWSKVYYFREGFPAWQAASYPVE